MSISHMERCFFDGCKVDVNKLGNVGDKSQYTTYN